MRGKDQFDAGLENICQFVGNSEWIYIYKTKVMQMTNNGALKIAELLGQSVGASTGLLHHQGTELLFFYL